MVYKYNPLLKTNKKGQNKGLEHYNEYQATYIIHQRGNVTIATPSPETGLRKYSGTDASTVIQSAIDALPAVGGLIHVKSGTYLLNTRIILRPGLSLQGEGFGHPLDTPRTLFKANSTSMTTIFTSLSGKDNKRISLSNFTVDANKLANIITAIDLFNFNDSLVENIRLFRFVTYGIYFRLAEVGFAAWLDTVINVTCIGEAGAAWGLLTGCSDSYFYSCEIGNSAIRNLAGANVFMNCHQDHNTNAGVLGGFDQRASLAVVLMGCVIETNPVGNGISLTLGAGAECKAILLGNIMHSNTGYDIYLGNIQKAVVMSNVCNSVTATHSIYCDGASTDNAIMGNSVALPINLTGGLTYAFGNPGYNPQALSAPAVGASPFTWTNNLGYIVTAYVNGGNVTNLQISRAGGVGWGILPVTNSTIMLYPSDALIITYVAAPALIIQPM